MKILILWRLSGKLEEEGVSYNFRENFSDKVMDKIFTCRINCGS